MLESFDAQAYQLIENDNAQCTSLRLIYALYNGYKVVFKVEDKFPFDSHNQAAAFGKCYVRVWKLKFNSSHYKAPLDAENRAGICKMFVWL